MSKQLHLSFVTFKKDSYIVVEGKANAESFYIINQGKVRISKETEVVAEEGGNILGPGDFFGVVSSMSSHSHIETAQAITDVVLISVHRDQYGDLIQKNTPVAMKIMVHFSRRLRYLDEALSRITFKTTAEPDITHLFDVAEYYVHQNQYKQAFYAYSKYIKYCPTGENVVLARQRMLKIAAYVKDIRTSFDRNEFNRIYPKDTMLFAEEEPGDELFIIQKGAVKIVKIVNDNEVLLAVLKPGDIFGEMALLEAKPRAASAIAFDNCQVLAVNRANFQQMISTQPQIIAKLTILLADRIWFIYKQLANTLIKDPLGKMYDLLRIQLEKNRIPFSTPIAHTFDFGPKELANMAGLPQKETKMHLQRILEQQKIQIVNNKIHAFNVIEIIKQTEYYRKMQRIENARQESRSTGNHGL
ncbi:MAG: cyclic nucleotide-binding domain-containing protein [Treponema sp.]|jgi:CRP-like cAMP-binding protein|nr:cyclic nucleotide-binding domain-containing protein [Treponema sp.]